MVNFTPGTITVAAVGNNTRVVSNDGKVRAVGAGVGVGLGVPCLILITLLFLVYRKKLPFSKANEQREQREDTPTTFSSPDSFNRQAELPTNECTRYELDVYKSEGQVRS